MRNKKSIIMILHGRNIVLLANGTAIAASKSCTLDVDAEVIKVSDPNDGQWEHAIAGRKSWKASCNHLVTDIIDPLAMIGTTVTLRMQVQGELGLPFDDIASNMTITEGSIQGNPQFIVWDTTSKQFLGGMRTGINRYYYNQWSGSLDYNGSARGSSLFYLTSGENLVYKKTGDDLAPEALQGSAIVKSWKVTGTIGNLAQGSFSFEGAAELTNPTT
jgi:hypothetical protein